jgi:hypothetical protein
MWFILKIIFLLIILNADVARAALKEEFAAQSDVWLAFAVGNPVLQSEGYTVKVYPAQSKSKTNALWRANTYCEAEANNCRVLPALTTLQLCRYVSAAIGAQILKWVYAPSPKGLQIKCMGLFAEDCSKPAGVCR